MVRGWVGQLYGALGEAAFLIGMERNQDVVELASYAPLLENVNYNAWFPNLIRFNNRESMAIPTYYVWKMFGNSRGENVVEAEEETGILYRPVKGMASLMGPSGLRYKNASWNGRPVGISHELMGESRKKTVFSVSFRRIRNSVKKPKSFTEWIRKGYLPYLEKKKSQAELLILRSMLRKERKSVLAYTAAACRKRYMWRTKPILQKNGMRRM